MLLLAFDTATPAVAVALRDGVRLLAESSVVGANRQGELLAPAIAEVLATAGAARSDLTGVVVGTGPGPFTGLRIGLVTARALGDAWAIPVHGVCTLDALAWAAGPAPFDGAPFVVATDARRREVYWARYADRALRVAGPAVQRPDALAAELVAGGFAGRVTGYGAVLYADRFAAVGLEVDAAAPAYPSGAALAELAALRLLAHQPMDPPEPRYLRRPDAVPPGPRKQVMPA